MMFEFLTAVSVLIIIIGLYGLMTKHNLIKMFIAIEIVFFGAMIMIVILSLLAVNPVLTQFFVLIIALIAALEEAVGVGIILVIKRTTGTINADELAQLKE